MNLDLPSVKQWQSSKKRNTWLKSLNDERLCLVIGVEIVSYNLELLNKDHDLMHSVLSKVYHQVLNPERFAAREFYNSVRQQVSIDSEHPDVPWSFLYLINAIVKGANVTKEVQRAVGNSGFAISCENQIQVLEWILSAHREFGLPAPLTDIGVCSDWLEQNGMQRLRIESILRG